jgi:hypothetical protein
LKPELQIGLITAAIMLAATIQIGAAPADIDAGKAAAIRELLEVTGAEANREELTRTFSGQLISVLQANNANLSDRAMSIIRDEVDTVVEEQLKSEALQKKMYRIYARYFTLKEIEGLIEFNRSSIGVKANRVMPILMRESMSAAQEWSEEIGPELSRRVATRLKKEGISIGH